MKDNLDTKLPDLAAQEDLEAILMQPEDDGGPSNNDAKRKSFAESLEMEAATFRTTNKAAKIEAIDARGIARASEAVRRLPAPNEYIHIVTGEDFIVFDLIPTLLALSKAERYDSLTFSTLGYGYNNLLTLNRMIDAGQIIPDTMRILASSYWRTFEKPMWQKAREHATLCGYHLRSTRNHTKIILLEIAGLPYVIESSSNMRSCRALEQTLLTQSQTLYDFHANWIAKMWDISDE